MKSARGQQAGPLCATELFTTALSPPTHGHPEWSVYSRGMKDLDHRQSFPCAELWRAKRAARIMSFDLAMTQPFDPTPPQRPTHYFLVTRALAVLLLAAAILKSYDLATVTPVASALLGSRPLTIAWINLEALLSLWLLLGLYPRPTRRAAIALFSLFALFASVKASAGDDSCGCFGRLRTNPWFILAIDVLAVVALLLNPPPSTATPRTAIRLLAFAFVGALLTTGLTATLVINRPPPPPATRPSTVPAQDAVDPVWT
jgi:hypothetical protein